MNRLALVISAVALFGTAALPNLRADEWNKRTVLTVNEPILLTSKVLEPGKYVMKLLSSPSDRHIVQVFDGTEQHLVTTVLAIPEYRLTPTDKTVFTFWETPPGQPKAMRAWFYPGDNFGQGFPSPKLIAASFAPAVPAASPAPPPPEPPATTAPAAPANDQSEVKPAEEPQQIAQATPPPAPAEQPAPSQAKAPESAPETLPHTASRLPLTFLAGLVSLGAFALLRLNRAS